MQNIPVRADLGRKIRGAFIPEEGWQFVSADYSQVELRLLAHFSGDEALLTAFAEDADVHARVAAQIFKVPEDKVTKQQPTKDKDTPPRGEKYKTKPGKTKPGDAGSNRAWLPVR